LQAGFPTLHDFPVVPKVLRFMTPAVQSKYNWSAYWRRNNNNKNDSEHTVLPEEAVQSGENNNGQHAPTRYDRCIKPKAPVVESKNNWLVFWWRNGSDNNKNKSERTVLPEEAVRSGENHNGQHAPTQYDRSIKPKAPVVESKYNWLVFWWRNGSDNSNKNDSERTMLPEEAVRSGGGNGG
jgi:hypothetical protein